MRKSKQNALTSRFLRQRFRARGYWAAVFALLVLAPAGCRAPLVLGSGPHTTDQGTVERTRNPQVARYAIRPHAPATVTVDFGTTPFYGLKTWSVAADGSHSVSLLVAGMRADTTYHLRATVHFRDGMQLVDTDHPFTTGHASRHLLPRLTVKTSDAAQAGVELLNPSIGSGAQAVVTDLRGNVLWLYNYSDRESPFTVQAHKYLHAVYLTLVAWGDWVRSLFGTHFATPPRLWDAKMWKLPPPERRFATIINPIKLLPNGDFLMVIGLASHALVDSPDGMPPPDTTIALREIDLAGNTVRNMTVSELNARLRATGYRGPELQILHHDAEVLPNGHIIVIANATRNSANLPGYPGTTRVIGDILVEVDANFKPVWTWSEFDHLDVNRHPMDFPDWTHTNAVLYTKDDGNLIVSMRSQHWVIKIDYRNGQGSGRILWRLGKDGDFRMLNGSSPADWNYGQHEPVIFSDRDAGVFDLGMMDNGNDRVLDDGKVCGSKDAAKCYTTVPIYRIDERARTATLVFHDVFKDVYSVWGGGVQNLANGDVQIDLCNVQHDSDVVEVTRSPQPRTVWSLHAARTNVYRAERLPSLYPGVAW